jgi:ribosomal-protein-alanine N-acetyltransferase
VFIERLSREAFGRFGPYDLILLGELSRSGVRTVIADAAGTPAGFAMSEPDERETYLLAIAVVPGWRRRGVARLLLREIEEQTVRDAARAWRPAVSLTVAEDNAPARALFASAGYRTVPSRGDPYPAGQRSLRMRKTIPASG